MEERKTLTLKQPVPLPLGKSLKEKAIPSAPVKSKEVLKAEKRQAVLIKEREDKKAAIELKKQKKQQMFELLFHDYPNCFSSESPKPLKQGIHLDIEQELLLKLSKRRLKQLNGCLHTYTNSQTYHQAMITQSHRIDLMGNPVKEISQDHKERAKQKLKLLEEKKKVTQATT